jgi:hypothetical protein
MDCIKFKNKKDCQTDETCKWVEGSKRSFCRTKKNNKKVTPKPSNKKLHLSNEKKITPPSSNELVVSSSRKEKQGSIIISLRSFIPRTSLYDPNMDLLRNFFEKNLTSLPYENKIETHKKTVFPTEWLERQMEYILKLSPENKVRMLGYTYKGDEIVNSYILGNFSPKIIISEEELSNYRTMRLHPLVMDMFEHIRLYDDFGHWKAAYFESPNTDDNNLNFFFKIIRNTNFQSAYRTVLEVMCRERDNIKKSVWNKVVESYIKNMTKILNGAPVCESELFVYRGVKKIDYMNIKTPDEIYEQNLFMSTSIDPKVAKKFTDVEKNCCLMELVIQPKTAGLLMPPLSYFEDEMEILFAPGKKLRLIKEGKYEYLLSD